jgi:hypothetical protein
MIVRLLLLSPLLAPGAAWACAVCQDPTDVRSKAYFDMTIFLSLFPLLAMGSIAWWLYRRFAAFEEDSIRA